VTKPNLARMTDSAIARLVAEGEKILRRRKVRRLLREECLCDRYTCPRCRELSALGCRGTVVARD
jgi:hypothetical protein